MEALLSLDHEIDPNPKPEDAGTFQICVTVLGLDTSIGPTLSFVISFDSLEAVTYGYYQELTKLRNWLCSVGLTYRYICFAISELTKLVFESISSVSSRVCATSVYMTSEVIRFPTPTEEAIQASFDEATNDIPSRPASKLAVGSLSRKIYKNNKKKMSNSDASMCTICMEDFKKGEMVVTLPCGHEFDDCCMVVWFVKNHVCPLCRFELPFEN